MQTSVVTAFLGILQGGAGLAQGPRVEDQSGAGEHVPGKLLGLSALEYVAVFLAYVALGHIESSRGAKLHPIGEGHAPLVEGGMGVETRHIPGGEDVNPGEGMGVGHLGP